MAANFIQLDSDWRRAAAECSGKLRRRIRGETCYSRRLRGLAGPLARPGASASARSVVRAADGSTRADRIWRYRGQSRPSVALGPPRLALALERWLGLGLGLELLKRAREGLARARAGQSVESQRRQQPQPRPQIYDRVSPLPSGEEPALEAAAIAAPILPSRAPRLRDSEIRTANVSAPQGSQQAAPISRLSELLSWHHFSSSLVDI